MRFSLVHCNWSKRRGRSAVFGDGTRRLRDYGAEPPPEAAARCVRRREEAADREAGEPHEREPGGVGEVEQERAQLEAGA